VDLAAAAARLRAATEELPATEDEAVAEEEELTAAAPAPPVAEEPEAVEPPAPVTPPSPEWTFAAPAPVAEEAPAFVGAPVVDDEPAPVAAAAVEEAADFAAATLDDVDHLVAISTPGPLAAHARRPLPARGPIGKIGPWLRDALVSLARDEPDIAELLLVGLLPLQAGIVPGSLAYKLAVDGGTTHRVHVTDDRVRVELGGLGTSDARISGPLAALVPLATGGAGRRLGGTRIQGRRNVRKLIKARRRPLGLDELAAAGVAPSPGLLLTVLARAVQPAWTRGRPLTVDVASEGADRWRVIASGHGPLAIFPAEGAPPAPATLHTSASRLPAVLAGTAQDGDAHVEGDAGDVRTLLSWLDRAQRAGA
jgi:hypothetical protein